MALPEHLPRRVEVPQGPPLRIAHLQAIPGERAVWRPGGGVHATHASAGRLRDHRRRTLRLGISSKIPRPELAPPWPDAWGRTVASEDQNVPSRSSGSLFAPAAASREAGTSGAGGSSCCCRPPCPRLNRQPCIRSAAFERCFAQRRRQVCVFG